MRIAVEDDIMCKNLGGKLNRTLSVSSYLKSNWTDEPVALLMSLVDTEALRNKVYNDEKPFIPSEPKISSLSFGEIAEALEIIEIINNPGISKESNQDSGAHHVLDRSRRAIETYKSVTLYKLLLFS